MLGPNGAGKTTLMLQLNALLKGEGELEVAGLRVGEDVRELRARVGLVFQDPDDQLFMPTVREDVAFGPLNRGCSREEVEDRIAEALAAVRMQELADRAPHQLSLGQRRRVAIATVLAMRPSLLVLDEPSANLDPRTRRELIELLDKVERTMLVVTHDLPLAATLCERAVILSAGRIVADGAVPRHPRRHRPARRPRPGAARKASTSVASRCAHERPAPGHQDRRDREHRARAVRGHAARRSRRRRDPDRPPGGRRPPLGER